MVYVGAIVAVVALALCSYAAVSFFHKDDAATPRAVSASTQPQILATAMTSTPSSSPMATVTSRATQAPAPQPTSETSTASSTDDEAAAVSRLDALANSDIASVDVSDDSWGARLSSKWVGVTDDEGGHPAPYTASEIEQELQGLKSAYGDSLKILKLSAVGKQNDRIRGQNGWMAVVIDPSITSEDSATAWCKAHFDGDATQRCGYQHLDAPH